MFLKKAEIDLNVDYGASVCFLEFRHKINLTDGIKINEEVENAQIGSKIEVSAGYEIGNNDYYLVKVFVGYIFLVEMEIEGNNTQKLIINSMDAKMLLMANKKTELKKNKKTYSDIVKNTLNNYLSKLSIDSIKISADITIDQCICQRNESDYDFLCRIADLTGCLFYISKGKVFFTNIEYRKSIKMAINPDVYVQRINFKSNILGIPKSFLVNKIDEKDYNVLENVEVSKFENIGTGKTATEHSNNISSADKFTILNNTIKSHEDAQKIATAKLTKKNLNFVNCEIETILLPDAELGTGMKIENFGNPFDNTYILTSIKHIADVNNAKTILGLSASCYDLKSNNPTSSLGSIL